MKRLRSIRWRLLFWYGLLLALILTGLGLVSYAHERTLLEHEVNAELEARVSILVRSVEVSGPVTPRIQPTPLPREDRPTPPPPPPEPRHPDQGKSPENRPRPAGHDPSGHRHPPPGNDGPDHPHRPGQDQPRTLLNETSPPPPSGNGHRPEAKALKLSPENQALFEGEDGFYYVVWLRDGPEKTVSANAPQDVPVPTEVGLRLRGGHREITGVRGRADVFLAGIRMKHPRGLAHFGWMLFGCGAAILGLGLLGGWWLITLSLRPIRSITTAATRIAGGDLSRRIDVTETESELGELALVLNRTFGQLEESFSRQERFTADAAHELRTPLTIILTHVQNGLAIPGNNEEQREAFEACERAARRMRNLVESLLHLSRIQAGEGVQRIPCDLAQLAEEAVDLVRPLARSRRATIHTDLASVPLTADPGEIHQVLVNLIGNAIHHGPDGVSVTVTTRMEHDFAVCTVKDNGPGIPAEDLPRIFDRFFRVDKARSPKAGHTGLGLAICQAIVTGHKGTITAESKPGTGANFTIRLPVGKEPGEPRLT